MLQEVLPQGLKASSRVLQAKELGTSMREAATRVFSNSSGSYSSNVNLAVENSSWSDEQQLQEMYLKRKSFAFNSDRLALPGQKWHLARKSGLFWFCGSPESQPHCRLWSSASVAVSLELQASAASHTVRSLRNPQGPRFADLPNLPILP